MSLMLRQACQPLLDELGLDMLHVGIDGDKSLSIVGSCGKPLLSLSGIRFGSFKPSNKEVEYAIHLFNEFLRKEGAKLSVYVVAKQRSTADDVIPLPDGCVAAGSYIYYRNGGHSNILAIYPDGQVTVGIKQSPEVLIELMTSSLITDALKYFKQAQLQATERETLREMQTELNKCDI